MQNTVISLSFCRYLTKQATIESANGTTEAYLEKHIPTFSRKWAFL